MRAWRAGCSHFWCGLTSPWGIATILLAAVTLYLGHLFPRSDKGTLAFVRGFALPVLYTVCIGTFATLGLVLQLQGLGSTMQRATWRVLMSFVGLFAYLLFANRTTFDRPLYFLSATIMVAATGIGAIWAAFSLYVLDGRTTRQFVAEMVGAACCWWRTREDPGTSCEPPWQTRHKRGSFQASVPDTHSTQPGTEEAHGTHHGDATIRPANPES